MEFNLNNNNNVVSPLNEDDEKFETQVFDSQSSQDEIRRSKKQEKLERKERENTLLLAGAIKNVTPNKRYKIPSTKLLPNPDQGRVLSSEQILEKMSLLKNDINSILETFKINAWVEEGNFNYGPTVLSFNVSVGVGVKVSRILKLADNFKLRLKATTIRIQAPIPGKPYVGIEIPNPNPETVFFKPIFDTSMSKRNPESKFHSIDVPLGKDIYGNVKDFSLTKSPHLLVAGTTGSGKSVLINVILTSILMNYKPEELRLLLIDPKMVEFVPYSNLPHLITPVIHDPKKSKVALDKLVEKMEQRFKEMAEYGVRNIESWNELRKSEGLPIVPYVVVIIDELADLMIVSGKEVEISIARITQKARAAGIHMIVATQRPSTDVITGLIKSNIPTRIAFAVSSSIDSRTILDGSGAEALLGRGDMLVSLQGMAPFRAQSPYVSDMEINLITRNIKQQQSPEFDPDFDVLEEIDVSESLGLDDPLLQEAIQIIRESGKASTSYLQRRLRIGYNKAADIIDALEDAGYVGPPNGSKPREVY
ncbi:MAG: DNA translocase FtsK [Mycoplasmataceae bacterium]|nr:DNA translocase FtsK [Mycoplasmataceae bacterium]